MQRLSLLCLSIIFASNVACEKKAEPVIDPALAGVFTTGQAASYVLGQSTMSGASVATNATGMTVPTAITQTASGVVYVTEQNNARALGFATAPTSNGEAATTVLGQNSFTSSVAGSTATEMSQPQGIASAGSQVFVADTFNHRILIFNSLTTGAAASFAIGQTTTGTGTDPAASVTATTIRYPYAVAAANGKIVVADTNFNRVLMYNSIPTTNAAAAAYALGQTNLTSGASGSNATMNTPRAVWTNGTKIMVADTNNNRVLIWNSWPSASGTAPDVILGQPTQAANTANNGGISASSLDHPEGVASNGTEVFISEINSNRVLYWKTWPTTNKQAADMVFGQPDFTTVTSGASATTMNSPRRIYYDAGNLYVADSANNRVLLFKKQ